MPDFQHGRSGGRDFYGFALPWVKHRHTPYFTIHYWFPFALEHEE